MAKSISELDKNLKIETSFHEPDAVWHDIREEPFDIYGLYKPLEGHSFMRMDPAVAEATNEGVMYLNRHTAGGRVRFRTDAQYIIVKALCPKPGPMGHMAFVGIAGLDCYASENGGEYIFQGSVIPPFSTEDSFEGCIRFPDRKMREIMFHFPLYGGMNDLYFALPGDAVLEHGKRYRDLKPALFYGSSITQGGCASRPGTGYTNLISNLLDMDHVNLGFSGSARAEAAMVDYLSKQETSIFVCDYDHNAPNVEHLKATHEPLYKAFRAAQPDTPILFLSKPDARPGRKDDDARRAVIMETYERAKANGDKNVWFVDGADLFKGPNRFDCTVDGCHPTDLGFHRMAQVIGAKMAEILDIRL